jgi:hypothetical protein
VVNSAENVVPITDSLPSANDAPSLAIPAHFAGKKAKQVRAAWDDLIASTETKLQTRENRFTFEFAATLMAKFRSGKAMSATESKELKRLLVTLGLAKGEDDEGGRKKGKLAKYLAG